MIVRKQQLEEKYGLKNVIDKVNEEEAKAQVEKEFPKKTPFWMEYNPKKGIIEFKNNNGLKNPKPIKVNENKTWGFGAGGVTAQPDWNQTDEHAVDFIKNKPTVPEPVTVDQTYDGTSSNAQSGKAVKQAVDEAVSSVYKPAGSVAFAELPSLGASVLGNLYNVTDAFTTTADFVEGAGVSYPANTNVGVIKRGSNYYFDAMSGVFSTALSSLTDVLLTTPADGETLKYDSDSGKWVNGEAGGGGGEDPNAVHFLSGASEPTTSTQGNVGDIYNNTNDNTKWILNSITKAENYTKKDNEGAGAITISSDYVASGFNYVSQNHYACLVCNTALFINVSNNPWEFCSKINMTSTSDWNPILGGAAGTYLDDLYINDAGQMAMNLSSTGSSYDITGGEGVVHGTTVLSTDTWYWVKYGWDGTTYYAEFSTDGTNYTREIEFTSSTPIAASSSTPYIGARIGSYFHGSIDLKETDFKNNGSITWSALADVYNWRLIETVLRGTSAPSIYTEGYVGQIYVNTDSYTPAAYICISTTGVTFNWQKITS